MSLNLAFFVVVEYVNHSGKLQYEDVGFSDDVDPEDFYMAVEDKDWTRLEWFDCETGDSVFIYDCPVHCTHQDETLVDESPSGCEYQCNECGFVRFEPNESFRSMYD